MTQSNKKDELAKLPVSRNQLADLFDHLDQSMADCGSDLDHSLEKTLEFIKSQNLNEERVLAWLKDKGGVCDCEILTNVEDYCMELFNVKSGLRLTRE